jgi:hypothetical protein
MKQWLFLFTALLLVAGVSCTSSAKKEDQAGDTKAAEAVADNTLTDQEKTEGWILMFDGESTDGWRGNNMETFPDTGWTVENGTIRCSDSGMGEAGFGGDILYDKKFTNFHFKVDWMISEGGNSGIFFLGEEVPDKQIWFTAPEYQILDNCSNHIDNTLGVNGNRKAGSLYDLIPPDPQNAKCANEWNNAEIIVYEGTVVFRTNGENTMEFHLWTQKWNEMIAGSKFPDFNPNFADVPKTGYIALQDHGHAVWFKNIKIREL